MKITARERKLTTPPRTRDPRAYPSIPRTIPKTSSATDSSSNPSAARTKPITESTLPENTLPRFESWRISCDLLRRPSDLDWIYPEKTNSTKSFRLAAHAASGCSRRSFSGRLLDGGKEGKVLHGKPKEEQAKPW